MRLSSLAAYAHFGVLLEVIGEDSHGSRGAPEFLQSLVYLLDLFRTGLYKAIGRV